VSDVPAFIANLFFMIYGFISFRYITLETILGCLNPNLGQI